MLRSFEGPEVRTSRQTGGLMTLTVRDLVNMAGTAFSPQLMD